MSWLQGLAGKAEGLLTRMDQTAANSLHSNDASSATADLPDGAARSWSASHGVRRSGSNSSTMSDFTGRYQGQVHAINEVNNAEESSSQQTSSIRRTASHQDFDWNAAQRPKHKRNTSSKAENDLFTELNSVTPEKHEFPSKQPSKVDIPQLPTQSNKPDVISDSDERADILPADSLMEPSSSVMMDVNLEAVVRENKLMKSELQGQSRELSMALSRVKRVELDAQKLLNQLSTERQRFAAENDARERDFLNALAAKDSQAAVSRVQLDEMEVKCKIAEARIAEASLEIRRLEQLSSNYNIRDMDAESSSRRIAEMEGLMQREKEHALEQIERLKSSVRVLEDQNRDFLSKIASLERSRVSDHNYLEQSKQQANLISSECEIAQRELIDYKQKALKILQSKDELINSLKTGNGIVSDEVADLEANEIALEREMLRDEVVKLREITERLTKQLSEHEIRYKHDCADLHERYMKAEQDIISESNRCKDMETSIKSYVDEINYVRMESSRKEQSLQQRLKDRDEDLQRMRQQLLTRSESRPTDVELESRMHILTEHLIQKQSNIETLNTEKHALSVQIERLERRLRESPRTDHHQESRINVGDSSDSSQSRTPLFLTENASDNQVSRNLKKAYSSVDRFSFRLGIFLRRYPLARIMVIAYMLLLHFWVLVVLLTYTPETHGSDLPGKK